MILPCTFTSLVGSDMLAEGFVTSPFHISKFEPAGDIQLLNTQIATNGNHISRKLVLLSNPLIQNKIINLRFNDIDYRIEFIIIILLSLYTFYCIRLFVAELNFIDSFFIGLEKN